MFLLIFSLFFAIFLKKEKIMQKLLSCLRRACEEYNLIENNDKIAVGLSGGKDSITLLTLLRSFQEFSPKKFNLIAIAVDLTNGQTDYSPLEEYCKKIDVPLAIVPSNVFEIVFDLRKEKNPCSLCANLRRGLLNSKAKELGCNKVALGHHKDDLIETFILSLFFEGRLSTFKPKSYLSRTEIEVIRPMIYIDEKEIEKISKNFPVIKNICKADKTTQRQKAKEMLENLNKVYPDAKEKIFSAIIHKERYNLFDKD